MYPVDGVQTIEAFTKISHKYQYQLRRKFAKEVCEKLKPHLGEDELLQVMRDLRLRLVTPNNSKNKSKQDLKMNPTKHAENINKSNLLKFLVRELKENMSKSTPMHERNRIAQKIINKMNEGLSFDDAKLFVYKQYNIHISYIVGTDNDRTNHENKDVEREYDEYSGKSIYGWDDDGEVLYEPTFGCLIEPPTFKEGGLRWREILENRWEQRSSYDEDETIHDFKG